MSMTDIGLIVAAKRAPKREQITLYLRKDLKKRFEDYGLEYGKGARSELVEELLMKFFIETDENFKKRNQEPTEIEIDGEKYVLTKKEEV